MRFHHWANALKEAFRGRGPWGRAVDSAAGRPVAVRVQLSGEGQHRFEQRLLTSTPDRGRGAFERWWRSLESQLPFPFEGTLEVQYVPLTDPERMESVELELVVGALLQRSRWLDERLLRKELDIERKGRLRAMSAKDGMLEGVAEAIHGASQLVWSASEFPGASRPEPKGFGEAVGRVALGVAEKLGWAASTGPRVPRGRRPLPPTELRERSRTVLAWAASQEDEALSLRLGGLRGGLSAAGGERGLVSPLRVAFQKLLAEVEEELANATAPSAHSLRLYELMTGQSWRHARSPVGDGEAPSPRRPRRRVPARKRAKARSGTAPGPGVSELLSSLATACCPACSEVLSKAAAGITEVPHDRDRLAQALWDTRVQAVSGECSGDCCAHQGALEHAALELALAFVEAGGELCQPAIGEAFDARACLLSEEARSWPGTTCRVVEVLAPGWRSQEDGLVHPAWVRVGLPVCLPAGDWPGLALLLDRVLEESPPELWKRLRPSVERLGLAATHGPGPAAEAAFRAWVLADWGAPESAREEAPVQLLAEVACAVLASMGGELLLPISGQPFDQELHEANEEVCGAVVLELIRPGYRVRGRVRTRARVRTAE